MLIMLEERPDLSPASALKTKETRVGWVYRTLLSAAQRSQAPLRRWLDGQGITYRWFYTTNAVLVEGDLDLALDIAGRPEVARIVGNPRVSMELPQVEPSSSPCGGEKILAVEWNIDRINAPDVWTLGHFGEGVVIGAMDTGYRWTHSALINRYRGWDGVVASHHYNWHDSIHAGGGVCGSDSPEPCDDDGHGTHTLGTILGSDFDPGAGEDCTTETPNQVGAAPCAVWIGCRNMDEGVGSPATYIECFDWFLAPYPVGGNPTQGDPAMAPDLTSNSWICSVAEGCAWDTLQASVDAHYAAGIMHVAAAGNDGPSCATIFEPPGMYENAFTIGATNSSDGMAGFSGRGPTQNTDLMKPNVVAPGVDVRSAGWADDTGYRSLSGTSMATPGAAGAVALLWSCRPGLKNDIDLTGRILESTATRLPALVESCGGDYVNGPNNTWGFGLINVLQACHCDGVFPTPPTGVSASAPAGNLIRVTWDPVPVADSYVIYRSDDTACPGGEFHEIGRVVAPTAFFDDGTVSAELTYAYRVRSVNECGPSDDSGCAESTATGICFAEPSFGGIASATDNETATCGVTLSWSPAQSRCVSHPDITYTVHRETVPGFTPGSANMIATCVGGTTYVDFDVAFGTFYHYLVRAEDSGADGGGPCNGGNIESNRVYAGGVPTGGRSLLHGTDFESGADGWFFNDADSDCSRGDWTVGNPDQVETDGMITQPGDDHTPDPGVRCFFTQPNRGGPGGDDVDEGVCIGLSPVADAGAFTHALVDLWYYHGQRDGGDDPDDYFRLDLSNDGGLTFTDNMVDIGDIRIGAAWTEAAFVLAGPDRIRIRVRASDVRGDSRSALMRILDWSDGHFELAAGTAEGEPELEDSVTRLLLEHARVRDESARRGRNA